MADNNELQNIKEPIQERLAPWKISLFISVAYALVSLPVTKKLVGKTIPALENSTFGYIAATTFIFFIVVLLILQNSS